MSRMQNYTDLWVISILSWATQDQTNFKQYIGLCCTFRTGTWNVGCKAESWRAEVVMSFCLHANPLLCSAQHCPPAPSSLPTLVPFGQLRLLHHTIICWLQRWRRLSSTSRQLHPQTPAVPFLSPGLLWHSEEPHGLINHQAEAGHGTVPRAMAVCGGHLADVQ